MIIFLITKILLLVSMIFFKDLKLKFVKAKYEDGILTIEFEPEIKAKSEIKSLPIE